MKRRFILAFPLVIACGPFFYQAPPSLEHYPQRIPGKTWREIFHEMNPEPADASTSAEIAKKCARLVAELPQRPVDARLEMIDQLIQENRSGDFRLRAANFLHELRELSIDDAVLASAEPYLTWQISRLNLRAGFILYPPTPRWNWDKDDLQKATTEYQSKLSDATQWLDEAIASDGGLLLPYLKTQKAALLFSYGNHPEAISLFTEVLNLYPEHPRAEVARLMRGRSSLELARQIAKKPQPSQQDRDQTWKLNNDAQADFEACLNQSPPHRFAADASGWVAAVASDRGDLGNAIRWQIKRLDIQPTREVTRSVLRECDQFFARLYGENPQHLDPEEIEYTIPFAEIGRHPEVCRLFVYQSLDPAAREALTRPFENFSGDRSTLDFLNRRIIRSIPLAQNCLNFLSREISRQQANQGPDAFTLTVLGWASYRQGEYRQAATLFEQSIRQHRSDTSLYGLALSLTAVGDSKEAVTAYDQLHHDFPESSITENSRFDHAIARFRAEEAGEALLLLLSMVDQNSDNSSSTLHPEHEPIQWIDTIAQFSPTKQLSAPLARLPANDPRAVLLRTIVRTRALAREDFRRAQRYLDSPETPKITNLFPRLPEGISIDRERWDRQLRSLAGTTALLNETDPAAGHLKLGRHWKKLRGKVTTPLHTLFDYSLSEGEKLETLRRKNARFLGYSEHEITTELDSRDELHHALEHFLIAAKSTDPTIAAPALEEANEALFQLAEFSLYGAARAFEKDHSDLSGQLTKRLIEEFPDSAEAKRVVAWNFPPPVMITDWMPGDYTPANAADVISQAILDPSIGRRQLWDIRDQENDAEKIRNELNQLATAPLDNPIPFRERLAQIRNHFDADRRRMNESEILSLVGDLDDLATVAAVPDFSDDLLRRYAGIRFSETLPPVPDGDLEPLAPWIGFLDCLYQINHQDSPAVPKSDPTQIWQRYLEQFPDGPKSEAASLRLLRQKVRGACPIPQIEAFSFPEAPILGGYKRLDQRPVLSPETSGSLTRELDRYEENYPSGNYRADVLLLRAAVNIGARNYAEGLRALTDVITDPTHPELRMNASLRFAEVGLRLLDKKERPAVAAAFREKREAIHLLKNLTYGDTCLSRLRPMIPWLETE